MRIVFDWAGVLFHWQPLQLLQRTLPQHAPDAAAAQRLADDIFQGYGGDWAEFDRGCQSPRAIASSSRPSIRRFSAYSLTSQNASRPATSIC